jgi:hypothetical protein
MKNAKEKLDEKLGITDITEIFNQDDIDAILNDSKIEIASIDKKIKKVSDKIDDTINQTTEIDTTSSVNTSSIITSQNKVYDLEESLSEISFLVNKSKTIITSLYKYITTTDFVDPDIISSTAKMIEASRIVISDYIELYKEKMRMIHAFNMEMQKHKNRLELEEHKAIIKQKYALKDVDTNSTEEAELVPYMQEEVMRLMNKSV